MRGASWRWCAEDARGHGEAMARQAGSAALARRGRGGASFGGCRAVLWLVVAFIVDIVGPAAETSLNRVELRGSDAVGRNLCQADAVCSAQTLCEESCVEACVAFLKELDEARIADRSGGADRIDVQIVAWVASGVKRTQFVADGVSKVKNGSDAEAYGCVGAPVDSEINAEWCPVWGVTESWAKEELARSTVTS